MNESAYEYQIGKFSALQPQSHPLPSYQLTHPKYDRYFGKWLRFLGSRPKVLDIGANIGDTSLFICSFSNAQVQAIEPMRQYFDYLQKNISRNSLEKKIFPFNLALVSENKKKNIVLVPKKGLRARNSLEVGKIRTAKYPWKP